MADTRPRVVVLGRPGDAQKQLQHALDELGAQTLAVGDFDQLDPAQMREQDPDVWLVSMDENLDAQRLERWQPLFDDPDATVIFDDADVTGRLSGWDLARWARHLAAKVLGRDDVLPPVSPDAERLPHAGDDAGEMSFDAGGAPADFDASFASDATDGSSRDDASSSDASSDEASTASDDAPALSLVDDAEFARLSASFDSEREQQDAPRDVAPAMALDDLLRQQDSDAPPPAKDAPAASGAPAGASGGGLAGLSLLDLDVDLSAPRVQRVEAADVGIDTSHLALESLEEAKPAAVQAESANGGLIAIIAGLGGPDALRQFLGALPASLPIPVLLWQHLDAGKHDRLAQQLAKATKLPVYVAKPGEVAKNGAIGVMGSGFAVSADSGWWIEQGSPSPSRGLAPALNDPGTTIVVLSGAEPAIVEPARAHGANGGQVLVQTPSTCFDGTAAAAIDGEGVTVGSPSELAAQAVARWTS